MASADTCTPRRWSYGILGKTGRGLTELQNVDTNSIDILVGSLAGCVATGGGFCTGREGMVEHQRLNSPAVTFSASLATFLTTTASAVIARFQSDEGARDMKTLQERIGVLRAQLQESDWIQCTSAPCNPVIHLTLKDKYVQIRCLSYPEQESLLQECVDEVRAGRMSSEKPLLTESAVSQEPLHSHYLPQKHASHGRLAFTRSLEGVSAPASNQGVCFQSFVA